MDGNYSFVLPSPTGRCDHAQGFTGCDFAEPCRQPCRVAGEVYDGLEQFALAGRILRVERPEVLDEEVDDPPVFGQHLDQKVTFRLGGETESGFAGTGDLHNRGYSIERGCVKGLLVDFRIYQSLVSFSNLLGSLTIPLRVAILFSCTPRYIDRQPVEANLALDPLTQYVIVREDIPRGLQSAQIVHASGESAGCGVPSGTYAVVLVVSGEAELLRLHEQLQAAGVPHKLITENSNGYTGQAMAIGAVPQLRSKIRRYFSSLPLLR